MAFRETAHVRTDRVAEEEVVLDVCLRLAEKGGRKSMEPVEIDALELVLGRVLIIFG